MKRLIALPLLLVFAAATSAQTTQIAPNVFVVESSADFRLDNRGSSDYLFSWTDSSGSYTAESDPTLILSAGQTYTFTRITSSHPFVITDSTLPVSGSDGSYSRATSDGSVISAATLQPSSAFTADPSPTDDFISWTPGAAEIGEYFYTCSVTSHTGMTGSIAVVPRPGSLLDVVLGVNAESGDFDTLIAAALEAGVADALLGEAPLTVFAPTDKAFARKGLRPNNVDEISASVLRQTLLYHVTAGGVLAEELLEDAPKQIEMLNGQTARIRVKRKGPFINRSRIIDTDIEADNGVVHVIRKMLSPRIVEDELDASEDSAGSTEDDSAEEESEGQGDSGDLY